jgi:steroid delta-isomerase-like uncharacterized protein
MSDEHRALVLRLFEEVWNKGNVSAADHIFAPNYTHHDPATPDLGKGSEGEKKRANLYRTAFPDLHLTIEDTVSEGQNVVVRWSCRGTHKGDLNGIAPTGKAMNISGISIARFAQGRMVEGWINWDALGLFRQLGVMPEPTKAKGAVR